MTVQEFNHVQLDQLKGNLYYSFTYDRYYNTIRRKQK